MGVLILETSGGDFKIISCKHRAKLDEKYCGHPQINPLSFGQKFGQNLVQLSLLNRVPGPELEVLDARAEQRTGISEVLVCQHLSDQPNRRDQRDSEGQRETGRPVLRPLARGILRKEQSRNRTQDPLPQPRLPQVFRRLWGLQVN